MADSKRRPLLNSLTEEEPGVRYIGLIGDISPALVAPSIQTFFVISGTSQEISVEC